MSDENGQEIGVNVYDDEDELIEDEEAAPKPVEVVREEILTVTRNTDTEDNDIEDDLRELVKSHSDQISRLAGMVESLQSQMKRIDQRRGSSNKPSSVKRNRTTTKTKKNKATSKKPKGKSSKRSNQF